VKGIGNLGGLMKQAKKLQEDLERAQAEIADLRITAAAGGGMVSATVNGKGDLIALALERRTSRCWRTSWWLRFRRLNVRRKGRLRRSWAPSRRDSADFLDCLACRRERRFLAHTDPLPYSR
jgi:hypothetical protein